MNDRASAEAHLIQWSFNLLDKYATQRNIVLSDVERIESELVLKTLVAFYLNVTFDEHLDDTLQEKLTRSSGVTRDIVRDILLHIHLKDLLGDPFQRQPYVDAIGVCLK